MSRSRLCLLCFLLAWLAHRLDGASDPSGPDEALARTDEALLKEHKVGLDDASLLAFFRQRVLTEADKAEIERLIRQLGSEKFAEREEASRKLIWRGPPVLPLLRPALKNPDVEIARRAGQCISDVEEGPGSTLPMAAVRVLARRRPAGAVEGLLRYAPFTDDPDIYDEVLTALVTVAGEEGKQAPLLAAALKDEQALRRAAAGYVLGRQRERKVRAVVQPLLADPDARVRLRTAQGLLAGRDKSAVPTLIALLIDGPADLAWQAEDLLLRLAGEQAPPPPDKAGNAEAQARWREAWQRWWKEQEPTIDLARLEDGPRQLGLTLGIEWNTNRVWECGRDGKQRWLLTVAGPMDAQVLPGNRVLIAEANEKCVRERDLKGAILWEHKVEGEPLNCQRLTNGNTFIGTRDSVLEVTREGKVVFHYKVEGGVYFHGVSRVRNGHYVYITNGGLVVELDGAGKKVAAVQLTHEGSWGEVEVLPGGRYLVSNYGTGRVQEVNMAGKLLWECSVPGACGVTRLPGGNTLLACNGKVVEVDRAGKAVWEHVSNGFVRRTHRR